MKVWVCVALFVLCFSSLAVGEIPQLLSYQGRITDNLGIPVADGTYTMRFRIYDQLVGGTLLWDSSNLSVPLSGGVFNVNLGGAGQPTLDLAFDQDYYLLVAFDGENQTPRRPLASVGYAYMASGLVPGTEVSGAVTDLPYAALKATNTGTTNDAVGLYGESTCPGGGGVFGYGTATTDDTYGVLGVTLSTAGMGVYGLAAATTGTTYGVYGASPSTAGAGVFGEATATTGYTYGGSFTSDSETGVGVGGWGTVGVRGETSAPGGVGVSGSAEGSTGSAWGVRGGTDQNEGRGVCGIAYAIDGENYGVYGQTNSSEGVGVYGYAAATGGQTEGVYGVNMSTEGRGVVGWAQASVGPTRGVYGRSDSPSGYGVYYVGGIGGSGKMTSVVLTSKGPTGLGVHTTAGDWVEDFGDGRLVNGRCHIELDQGFLETVTIDDRHPMKVFVQLHDETSLGVAVRKGTTTFDVVELGGGISSGTFDYRVAARRKGFEETRLGVVGAARDDPYLRPELDSKEAEQIPEPEL